MADENDHARRSQTPVLCDAMAWLGVACMGTAFGTFVDPAWRAIILQTGVVGVVAALGLSKADRYRLAFVDRRKQRADEALVQKRLGEAVVALVPGAETAAALDRILRDVCSDERKGRDRRAKVRASTSRRLLTITTCDSAGHRRTVSGCLKDISGWGVGFVHRDELPVGIVAVTFTINGEPVTLEVEIRWTKKTSKRWFHSGGYFVAARQAQEEIDALFEQRDFANAGISDTDCTDRTLDAW
jgi:hypothetical protein